MVYEIDGKYYVLAARKFREVTISKDRDGFDVKVVKGANPIEYSKNINAKKVSLEQAFSKRGRKNED